MIVRPRPGFFRLLFVVRGTILPRVLPHVLGIAALACLVVLTLKQGYLRLPVTSPAPLSLLGIALSIFLGFRNNACYDRWWEARKQWGALIIELRAFTHAAIALLDDGRAEVPVTGVGGHRGARKSGHRKQLGPTPTAERESGAGWPLRARRISALLGLALGDCLLPVHARTTHPPACLRLVQSIHF